jgi:hypothetical protein
MEVLPGTPKPLALGVRDTTFPSDARLYIRGHAWLARQRHDTGSGFVQHDNAFTHLEDPVQAQSLADRFPRRDGVEILNAGAGEVNPLLGEAWRQGQDSSWVINQVEDR